MQRNLFKDRVANIVKVNLSFDLDKQRELEKLKREAIQAKKNALSVLHKTGSYPAEVSEASLESNIALREAALEDLEKDYLSGWSDYFAGSAFVSFNTEAEKEEAISLYDVSWKRKILSIFKKNSLKQRQLVFHGKRLVIEQAPGPSDIYWENLKISMREKMKRRLIGNLILLMVILLGALAIFGLTSAQVTFKNQDEETTNEEPGLGVKLLALFIALAIPLVNFILVICIKSLTE